MNELKISKGRVLEAASQCPDARRVLETLFPEAFEKPIADRIKVGTITEHLGCRFMWFRVSDIPHSGGNVPGTDVPGMAYIRLNGTGRGSTGILLAGSEKIIEE